MANQIISTFAGEQAALLTDSSDLFSRDDICPPQSAQQALPLAKLTQPRCAGKLPRTRLFQRLDEARSHSVIWLSGLPGSGKTSLVASYLQDRGLPGLWYDIDRGDVKISGFLHYLGLAATQATSGLSPWSLPAPGDENDAGVRSYFESLFNRFKPPFVMVFDNYQELPENSLLHDVLREGAMAIPKGGTVIFISRGAPPKTMARLLANQIMTLMDGGELRLTLQEARDLIQASGLAGLSETEIKGLYETTEGWAAGLALMLDDAKANGGVSACPGRDLIADYFNAEVLSKLGPGMENLMLDTAFLPFVTGLAAEQLSGLRGAERMLFQLSRQHCFIEKLASAQPVYRYHNLFREFLLARARQVFSSSHYTRLQHRAAHVLEAADRIDEAVQLFHDSGDWAEMTRLILKRAPALITQGVSHRLEAWLSRLPTPLLEQTAWFQYWLGIHYLSTKLKLARRHIETAFALFTREDHVTGQWLAWCATIEVIWYEQDDFTRMDAWIAWLDERGGAEGVFPNREIETRVACAMVIALTCRQPGRADVARWVERVMMLAQSSEDINLRMQIGFHTLVYFFTVGNLPRLEDVVDSCRNLAALPDASTASMLMWKWMEGAHYFASPWAAEADVATEALEIAQRHGMHGFDHFFCGLGSYHALAGGDLVTLGKFLFRMKGAIEFSSRRLDVSLYHHLSSMQALFRDDLTQARLHGETALQFAEEAGAPFFEALCRLELVQVYHDQGEQAQALVLLAQSRTIARDIKSTYLNWICLLSEAQLILDRKPAGAESKVTRDTHKQGFHLLRQAMTLGREQGYFNAHLWRSTVMARLCAKALGAGIEIPYVQSLIRRRNLLPDSPPVDIEHWPWAVKIYTLGGFRLEQQGQPIQFGRKAQRKPMELLKTLIALGGRDVREDQLADILWPNTEGDIAHRDLATTLHRLRKLIRNEKAITLRGGRLALDTRYCWVDIWAFEQLLVKAEAAGSPELTETALALYQGHFLEKDTESYIISQRERLRSKYVRHVGEMGRYLERSGQWEKAARWYDEGLKAESLAEDLYRRLMICYQHLGRRGEAVEVYYRCRKTLSMVLGIKPSAQTEAVYESLM